MVIDVDHVFFKNLPKPEQALCATLRAPRDFGIAPRTVLRTELTVHSARGEFLIPKLCGIASSAIDEVGVWDTLNEIDGKGCICTVVTNMSDEIIFRRGAVVGLSLIHISEPCLLYTSPSPRDGLLSRMPSSA